MDNVSEPDILLPKELEVVENKETKNKIKVISKLPVFLYLGDGEFIY